MNLTEKSSLTLSCIARGDPAPSIVWELPTGHVSTTLPPRNKSVTMNIGSVRIGSTSASDAGAYKCLTLNPVGNDTGYSHVNVLASKQTQSRSRACDVCTHFLNLFCILLLLVIVIC